MPSPLKTGTLSLKRLALKISLISLAAIIILLWAGLCPEVAAKDLKSEIINCLAQWGGKKTIVGVKILRLKPPKSIFAYNDNYPMIPASNLKLFTSACALATLGKNFTFATGLYAPLPEGASITGNLTLYGTGDPTLQESDLEAFALELYRQGIRKIDGDLVADDSCFDRNFLGAGWKERYLLYDYAPASSALSLNSNTICLSIRLNKITFTPYSPVIKITNKLKLAYGTPEVAIKRELSNNNVTVVGTMNPYETIYDSITLYNPPLFTASVLAQKLSQAHIKLAGKVRLITDEEKGRTLELHRYVLRASPPLLELLRHLNKESDNFYAQQVFKALGAKVYGLGSHANGVKVVKNFLTAAGISAAGFQMADGCGLSVLNKVTPQQVVALLEYLYNSPLKNDFISTLPYAGRDGTLTGRLNGLQVRAKTGGLQGHNALSGYLVTAYGQTLIFSIIANQHPCSNDFIREREDRLIKLLAGWKKPF